jgi:SAM-dependent methyltransferase
VLIDNCSMVVSIDISMGVEANLKNCSGKVPYFLCQADINASPLPYLFFDVVICLGVIQHTPCPEITIASLAKHLKPGGLLVIDHYSDSSRLGPIGQYLTLRYPLRSVFKRLSRVRPELVLKVTTGITAICDPIRRRTCRLGMLDSIASRVFPSACNYLEYSGLPSSVIRMWNELDTHDMLTDWYKHYRSSKEIHQCLIDLGFRDIVCRLDGNGVEARARASRNLH